MEVTMKIENWENIKRVWEIAPKQMARHLQDAITKSVFLVHAEAKRQSPKMTGQMSSTHEFKISPLRGEIYPTTKYAPFVHEGHSQRVGRYVPALGKRLVQPFVKGKPWLKWTVEAKTDEVNKQFDQAVTNTLNEIGQI